MSDNLPANAGGLKGLREHAEYIHESGFAPGVLDTVPKIMAVLQKGLDAGVPPMQALAHIHIVKGVPTMSAELMAALARRAGHKVRVIETTAERATVQGERADDPGYTLDITFTLEEADAAGLLRNPVWRSYKPAMLRARATSALCKAMFQDVLAGISYTPEEVGESGFDQLAPPSQRTPEAVEYGELDDDRHLELLRLIDDAMAELGGNAPAAAQVYPYARQSTAKAERTLDQLRDYIASGGAGT